MVNQYALDIIMLLAGMALGAGIVGIVLAFRSLHRRIAHLETASKRRLPYRCADEIEDATAALLSAIFDLDIKEDKLRNALAHLQKARNPETGNAD